MTRMTLAAQLTAAQGEIARLNGQLLHAGVMKDAAEANVETYASQVAALNEKLTATFKQLDQTQHRLTTTEESLAKVTKDLESRTSTNIYNSSRGDKAEAELEQLHAVLDTIEGAPSREYPQEYGTGKRTVITRLTAAFMAVVRGA